MAGGAELARGPAVRGNLSCRRRPDQYRAGDRLARKRAVVLSDSARGHRAPHGLSALSLQAHACFSFDSADALRYGRVVAGPARISRRSFERDNGTPIVISR